MGTNLFDYLIILSGLYLVYTGINMKQTGEIKTGGYCEQGCGRKQDKR